MKNPKWDRLAFALVTSVIGLVLGACIAQPDPPPVPNVGSVAGAVVAPAIATCTSDCSGTGGTPITLTNCTTCSATNSSVTCDGVTTTCTAPGTCVQPPPPTRHCGIRGGWQWCGCPDPNDPLPRGWLCKVCG
jgi:hypothetical protein